MINLIIFSSSCDSKIASQNQTMTCANTFYFIWQIGLPLTMGACYSAHGSSLLKESEEMWLKGQAQSHRAVGSSRKTVTEDHLAKTVAAVNVKVSSDPEN